MRAEPAAEWTISNETDLSRCGWTPYDGRTISTRIDRTMTRGRDAYLDGVVVGTPGSGRQVGPAA